MELFKKVWGWLSGKKWYFVVTISLGLVIYISATPVTFDSIPVFIWTALQAIGWATIRDAVNSASKFDNKGFITYLFAAALAICAIVQGFGVTIPAELIVMLDGGGAYGFRNALAKLAK